MGKRQWCNFVVFALKGISLERVAFDQHYREKHCFQCLQCSKVTVSSEIVSLLNEVGLPIRDLSNM